MGSLGCAHCADCAPKPLAHPDSGRGQAFPAARLWEALRPGPAAVQMPGTLLAPLSIQPERSSVMSKQSKRGPQAVPPIGKPPGGLGGENPRREVAGCPTGLADPEQAIIVQQPGGGGSPGTGVVGTSVPPSPGEGVTEE